MCCLDCQLMFFVFDNNGILMFGNESDLVRMELWIFPYCWVTNASVFRATVTGLQQHLYLNMILSLLSEHGNKSWSLVCLTLSSCWIITSNKQYGGWPEFHYVGSTCMPECPWLLWYKVIRKIMCLVVLLTSSSAKHTLKWLSNFINYIPNWQYRLTWLFRTDLLTDLCKTAD